MFYYKKMKGKTIISIESKSKDIASPGFIPATENEYNQFIASLPVSQIKPGRDLVAEIDALKAEVEALKKR